MPPAPPAEPAHPAANQLAAQPYGQPVASPYYAPQGAYGTGQPVPPRSLSVASMVCGIAGVAMSFFLIGFLPALAGVILGHIGRKKEPAGKAFSLTGIITGYVGLALSLLIGLFMLAVVLLPFWMVGTATSSGLYT
jgi:hypothetical protein